MSGPGPHDPRGGAPPPQGEGDDLLALAYGELDGAAERTVRARVASDPVLAGRLADMERVRSMFGAMEDEDPPPGLSAQLLAHAAQVARPAAREAAGSGEGFWARLRHWLSPIAAHPGLAAAASILLVAGVAGVLVARKGPDLGRSEYQAAQSAASTEADRAAGPVGGAAAPAPSEAPAAAPEPTADNAALEDGESESQAMAKSDDAVLGKELASRPSRRSRDAAKPSARAEESPAPATPPAGTALGLREGAEDAKSSTAVDRSPPAKQKSGKDVLADEDARGDAPTQAPVTTAPTAPTAAPPADSSGSGGAAPDQPAPSVAELHKRALSAASSRRCLEVQSIDKTVRGLDPAYSDSVFRADRRLATCLPAVKRAKRAK